MVFTVLLTMVITVMFAVMFKVALTVDCGDDATGDNGDADRKHKTCDDVLAHLLVTEGFSSVEEVAYVPIGDLLGIEGFDEDLSEELRNRANVFLTEQEESLTSQRRELGVSDEVAAIAGLTRDLAQQWGSRKGIRVNAIAPGFFETEMTESYPDGYLESMSPRLVLGRTGDPEELAATAIWLASPAAGYVTGQTVVVDGGFSIT